MSFRETVHSMQQRGVPTSMLLVYVIDQLDSIVTSMGDKLVCLECDQTYAVEAVVTPTDSNYYSGGSYTPCSHNAWVTPELAGAAQVLLESLHSKIAAAEHEMETWEARMAEVKRALAEEKEHRA